MQAGMRSKAPAPVERRSCQQRHRPGDDRAADSAGSDDAAERGAGKGGIARACLGEYQAE